MPSLIPSLSPHTNHQKAEKAHHTTVCIVLVFIYLYAAGVLFILELTDNTTEKTLTYFVNMYGVPNSINNALFLANRVSNNQRYPPPPSRGDDGDLLANSRRLFRYEIGYAYAMGRLDDYAFSDVAGR